MNQKADIWGPYAWRIFHQTAIAYPENPCLCNKEEICKYYSTKFLEYINCGSCRKHYIKLLKRFPIRAESNIELFYWSVDIHNMVNIKLGKCPLSYDEAYVIWYGYY